jgi:hypothetical protein
VKGHSTILTGIKCKQFNKQANKLELVRSFNLYWFEWQEARPRARCVREMGNSRSGQAKPKVTVEAISVSYMTTPTPQHLVQENNTFGKMTTIALNCPWQVHTATHDGTLHHSTQQLNLPGPVSRSLLIARLL